MDELEILTDRKEALGYQRYSPSTGAILEAEQDWLRGGDDLLDLLELPLKFAPKGVILHRKHGSYALFPGIDYRVMGEDILQLTEVRMSIDINDKSLLGIEVVGRSELTDAGSCYYVPDIYRWVLVAAL